MEEMKKMKEKLDRAKIEINFLNAAIVQNILIKCFKSKALGQCKSKITIRPPVTLLRMPF